MDPLADRQPHHRPLRQPHRHCWRASHDWLWLALVPSHVHISLPWSKRDRAGFPPEPAHVQAWGSVVPGSLEEGLLASLSQELCACLA